MTLTMWILICLPRDMTLISRGLHSQGLLDTLPSAIKETHKENVFVKLTGNTLRSVYMVEYKICTPATLVLKKTVFLRGRVR